MPFVSLSMNRALLPGPQVDSLLKSLEDAVASVEGDALRRGIGVAFDGAVDGAAQMRNCVAFIRVTLVRDALSKEQRETMAQNLVNAAVASLGEDKRPGIWVVIEESVHSGEWLVGGLPLTLDALAQLKLGRNPWA